METVKNQNFVSPFQDYLKQRNVEINEHPLDLIVSTNCRTEENEDDNVQCHEPNDDDDDVSNCSWGSSSTIFDEEDCQKLIRDEEDSIPVLNYSDEDPSQQSNSNKKSAQVKNVDHEINENIKSSKQKKKVRFQLPGESNEDYQQIPSDSFLQLLSNYKETEESPSSDNCEENSQFEWEPGFMYVWDSVGHQSKYPIPRSMQKQTFEDEWESNTTTNSRTKNNESISRKRGIDEMSRDGHLENVKEEKGIFSEVIRNALISYRKKLNEGGTSNYAEENYNNNDNSLEEKNNFVLSSKHVNEKMYESSPTFWYYESDIHEKRDAGDFDVGLGERRGTNVSRSGRRLVKPAKLNL